MWAEEKIKNYKFPLIPFLLTQNGETITICDNGFPNVCGGCEHRFKCYTQAEKFVTLLEYQTYWKR